ncbi:uncharacterized protein LOC118833348 [Trichosurus vulpecula]|uniref:uncharacterized protein LOC118833348 n=1 Tax=Trichosurus vulpecula TaxID=9337 RepID=UPI00186B34A3|nr:uncharacterized protein LOC118833348 [Trichosurus vulpecula]
MTPPDSTSGCPSAESVRSHPQQTRRHRRRGRRPQRKNRTVRAKQRVANALRCLLAMIPLVTPSTAAPAILPPLAAKPTHWALTPNLPLFQLMTWSHEALPLLVSGDVSVITGGSGKPLAIVERRYDKTLSWHTWAQPICVFTNDTAPGGPVADFCFPLTRQIREQEVHPWSATRHWSALRVHMAAISRGPGHDGTVVQDQNQTGPSPLPPCRSVPWVYNSLQPCSTGHHVPGPTRHNVTLSFWNGITVPTLVAPVPIPQPGRPQTHIWKIGLALQVATVAIGLYSDAIDFAEHRDEYNAWKPVFRHQLLCPLDTEPSQQYRCVDLAGTVQTGPNAMFLLCLPIHTSITYMGTGYNVSCSEPLVTNTLNSSHANFTIFLLRIPSYTIHPVEADPFALSPSDGIMRDLLRPKRDVAVGTVLSIVNLALTILEEVQILQLQKQVAFLASSLQNFMVQSGLAWKHQEQIDRVLFSELQTFKEVLEVVVQQQALLIRYMRLQCHYKYYPVCVTPIPYNVSQYDQLEWLLKDASTATNFTTELHMLDEVIAAIQNATIQFNGDWEENYNNAKAWWDTLSVHQLLQWASIGGLVLILAFLICLLLPCLISCMIGVLRRSLEAVKADVIKQKGGVVRGALDLGLLKG